MNSVSVSADTGEEDLPVGALFDALHRAEQRAKVTFAMYMGDNDVTLRQGMILLHLLKHVVLTQKEISSLTSIDRSTVAELVGRMIKRDLLMRSRSKRDARTKEVRLSPRGQTIAERIQPAYGTASREFASGLSGEDVKMLLKSLEALGHDSAAPIENASPARSAATCA